jgi:hypothetical protein
MKRILLILLVCLFQNFISAATITSTATGGNWNSTSSWIGGVVPTASDDVVIASGATVIVSANILVNNISILSGGKLTIQNNKVLTIYGNVIINTSAEFNAGSGNNESTTIKVFGNFTNQGTANFWKSDVVIAGNLNTTSSILHQNGNILVGGNVSANISGGGNGYIYPVNPNVTVSVSGTSNAQPAGTQPTNAELIALMNEVIYGGLCAPSISLNSIVASDACKSNNLSTVTVKTTSASMLPVGNYTITYDLYNNNNNLTASMVVSTAGTGVFNANVAAVNAMSSANIRIKKIASSSCYSDINSNNYSNNFYMYPLLSAPVVSQGYYQCDRRWIAQWSPDGTREGYYIDLATDSNFTNFVSGYQNKYIAGGNIQSETIENLAYGGVYYLRLRAKGYCGTSANSNTVTITIVGNYSSTPGTIEGGASSICVGSSTTFTKATYSSPGGQWSIFNQTGSATITAGGQVTGVSPGTVLVVYTTQNGGCGTSSSRSLTITGGSASAASATPTLCSNTALTPITHTTTGFTGIGTATGLPQGVSASFANSVITITGTPTVSGVFNYIIPLIGGACGNGSATGQITVTGAPATPGAIVQPTNKCANSTGKIYSIAPVTGATSYTWSVTGTGWAVTAGATTTVATIKIGSGVGTVSVTATNGCGTSLASTTGNITPDASLPASVSITASSSGAICPGTEVTFSAIATNEGTAPVYQWKVNGNNVGINSPTYTTTALANNDIVTVVMTSNASPCLTGSPATSNNVTMIVNPIPSVPIIGTITNITCTTTTGSVVLNNLPSGNWVLNSNGAYVASGTGTTHTLTGLSAGTYTFTVSQGSCTSAASLPLVINEVANIWDGTKWSKTGNTTLPTADDKIVFEGNYTVTSDLTGCSCTVNSGNVTVSSGKILSITNAVNVNGGTLTFENNASLIQSANVTNMGEITYKRTTAAMKNFDFTYWSSPVSGQTFVALSPNTLSDKYMSYSSTGWKSEAPSSVMKPGFGYIIRTPKAGLWPNGEQVSFPYYQSVKFVGVPNNGDIPGQTVATGYFYLIGNPYPSAISADDFLFDNANNNSILNGTIYFWTHNTAIQQSGSQYIYKSDDYASYNRTGGVTATSGGQEPSGYIAAGQSFFASAKNAGTVAFTNDMRIGGENTQFFKPAKTGKSAKIERNRLWLNMTNTGGAYKQTLIGYISGASNDFDQDFDGVSFDGNSFIDFYSINNAKKLTIQGRALPFIEADMVPLGYRTTLEGDFTISINKADGKLSAQQVFLEDKELNVVHELSAADYTFTTKKGTFNERFVIKYTNRTLGNDTFEKLDENVAVIVQNKIIRIQSVDENIEKVYVYNLLGQQLHIEEKVADSQLSIDASSMSHQVVLVKILLQNGKQVTRKTILK